MYSCHGSEKDYDYPSIEGWDVVLAPPPLASLAPLTELSMAGVVQLSPDFYQLSQLQGLVLTGAIALEGQFEWGAAPLTGLASPTRVELHQGDTGMNLPGEHRREGPRAFAHAGKQLNSLVPELHLACRPDIAGLSACAGGGACPAPPC